MKVLFSEWRPLKDEDMAVRDVSIQTKGEWVDIKSWKLKQSNPDLYEDLEDTSIYVLYQNDLAATFERHASVLEEIAAFIASYPEYTNVIE
jgi:hypothetical protein